MVPIHIGSRLERWSLVKPGLQVRIFQMHPRRRRVTVCTSLVSSTIARAWPETIRSIPLTGESSRGPFECPVLGGSGKCLTGDMSGGTTREGRWR